MIDIESYINNLSEQILNDVVIDYKTEYNKIIDFYKINKLEKSEKLYTEVHHIIPRKLKGSDNPDNLVRVTGKAHYILHFILYRSYKPNTHEHHAMMHGFSAMNFNSDTHKDRYYDCNLYQKYKQDYIPIRKNKILSMIKEIYEFMQKHDHIPKRNSSSDYEHKLGSRVSDYRQHKSLEDNWCKEFDDLIKDLDICDVFEIRTKEYIKNQTIKNIKSICEFYIKNNRLPNYKFQSEIKMTNQLTNIKRRKRDTLDWHSEYDDIVKYYNLSDDFLLLYNNEYKNNKKIENITNLCIYITTNKKLPNRRSSDSSERKFGSFLRNLRHLKKVKKGHKIGEWKKEYDVIVSKYKLDIILDTSIKLSNSILRQSLDEIKQ